jgi:tetratricopeptide (TPR) repeat protein
VSTLDARLVGVVGLFEAAEPESEWDYAGFGEYAELSPHLLALAGHLDTTGVDRLRAARLLFRVGVSLQRRGDYQASLETLQRALTINEAAYEPNHPNLAATLTSIGNTQQLLGDYQASLETLQRALTIEEAAYEPNHPNLAITLTNIGDTHHAAGDREQARHHWTQAHHIFLNTHGPNHPHTKYTADKLG